MSRSSSRNNRAKASRLSLSIATSGLALGCPNLSRNVRPCFFNRRLLCWVLSQESQAAVSSFKWCSSSSNSFVTHNHQALLDFDRCPGGCCLEVVFFFTPFGATKLNGGEGVGVFFISTGSSFTLVDRAVVYAGEDRSYSTRPLSVYP